MNDPIFDLDDDLPINGKAFKIFVLNHWNHLKWQVDLNTKLNWIILGTIIGTAITVIVK